MQDEIRGKVAERGDRITALLTIGRDDDHGQLVVYNASRSQLQQLVDRLRREARLA